MREQYVCICNMHIYFGFIHDKRIYYQWYRQIHT